MFISDCIQHTDMLKETSIIVYSSIEGCIVNGHICSRRINGIFAIWPRVHHPRDNSNHHHHKINNYMEEYADDHIITRSNVFNIKL